jgi:N-acetylglucosamine kinase-like BadF-type ATPase
MTLFAGLDGGQSSTHAVIADETGRIVGRGSGGPSDEIAQGPKSTRLRDALRDALADARRNADLPNEARFAAVVAGVSGYDGRVRGQPPVLPTERLILEHDAPIAHAGAFAGKDGVIVIAGTGSVAYGHHNGVTKLAGGWGYLFGDEGSAFWIAKSALSLAMMGDMPEVEHAALAHFGQPSLRAFAHAFYTGEIDRARVAAFAPAVLELPSAQGFRAGTVMTLASLALSVALDLQARTIACVGGVFAYPNLRDMVATEIVRRWPEANVVEPKYDPEIGALILAYREAGVTVPEAIG